MFTANRAAGRKALAPFVTAGDPDADTTVAVLETLDKAGASLCELVGPDGRRPVAASTRSRTAP